MAKYIVLSDVVTYRHPESNPAPGAAHQSVEATLGQEIGTDESDDAFALPVISQKEATRLEALGAVTKETDGLHARLAKSGQRPDPRMSAQYASLTSSVEQQRSAVAIAQMAGGSGPQSSKASLLRLSIGDLQRLAAAFGAKENVYTSDDKEEIVTYLKGEGEDAESEEDRKKQEKIRDSAQMAAREFGEHISDAAAAKDASPLNEDEGKKVRRKSAAAESHDKS